MALIEPRAGVEPLLADYMISAEKLYYIFLGYAGQLDSSRNTTWFRRVLREALGSSEWADSEAAKVHEAVSEIDEMESSCKKPFFDCTSATKQRVLFTSVQKCLAKRLGKPIDSQFCEGDLTYDELIQHFQAFPRGEDPGTWRQFKSPLLRSLEILPIINNSLSHDDLSDWRLDFDFPQHGHGETHAVRGNSWSMWTHATYVAKKSAQDVYITSFGSYDTQALHSRARGWLVP